MIPALVFHRIIVVSLTFTEYHWGTFIAAYKEFKHYAFNTMVNKSKKPL